MTDIIVFDDLLLFMAAKFVLRANSPIERWIQELSCTADLFDQQKSPMQMSFFFCFILPGALSIVLSNEDLHWGIINLKNISYWERK